MYGKLLCSLSPQSSLDGLDALGWLVTTKVYSGTGADIVMESIALTDLLGGQQTAQACDIACFLQWQMLALISLDSLGRLD
jgi:hypothetical protein